MAELPGMSSRQRWTLALVCTAAFMLLLDITVVSVALPSIQRDLRAVPGKPRDECFLGREVVRGLDGALAYLFARGHQLAASALGERRHADRGEHVVCGPQVMARVDAPVLATQPLAVQQVGAGQIWAELGAAEPVDRLLIQTLGGLAFAQQRPAAG